MASQRLFGPNQPFRLVENHHFLSNAKNNQVESVDIANMVWPMKCSYLVLEFIYPYIVGQFG